MGRELVMLLAGLFGGVGLAAFASPMLVRFSIVAATTLLAVRLVWQWGTAARALMGIAAAFLVGGLTTPLFEDVPPPLTYSLRHVSDDDAAPYRVHADAPAWYLLRVMNESDRDVHDLHVSVHLSVYLAAPPVVEHQTRVDGLRAKTGYGVGIVKNEGERALPVAGFTNVAVVEATRLRAGGHVEVAIPVARTDGERDERGNFGTVSITRRHRFMNVDVDDAERYPITGTAISTELLDVTTNDRTLKMTTLSPQIPSGLSRGPGYFKWQFSLE